MLYPRPYSRNSESLPPRSHLNAESLQSFLDCTNQKGDFIHFSDGGKLFSLKAPPASEEYEEEYEKNRNDEPARPDKPPTSAAVAANYNTPRCGKKDWKQQQRTFVND